METNQLYNEADRLLSLIADGTRELNVREEELATKIKELEAEYAPHTDVLKAKKQEAKKQLVKLMKKNKSEFFGGDIDRVNLMHGALLYQQAERVKRPRKITTETLEALGYHDAVRISKSVDWDAIEKWSDVMLAEIGTERVPKESFNYELK